jgi:hypothetical protein
VSGSGERRREEQKHQRLQSAQSVSRITLDTMTSSIPTPLVSGGSGLSSALANADESARLAMRPPPPMGVVLYMPQRKTPRRFERLRAWLIRLLS